MRISSQYRTIILQLNPDRDMVKTLRKSMEWVQSFLDMSRIEIQKMMYNKWKEMGIPMSSSIVSLLTQRFSGSATGKDKRFLYVYDKNSRFVFDKEWFLEVQLYAKTGKHIVPRVSIPVHRTEVPYYQDIKDMEGYGTMITEEAAKWFAYVSVPVESHEDEWDHKVVGIDFNMRKWVASMRDGRPLIFDVTEYSDRIDRLQAKISRKQSAMRKENDPDIIGNLEREVRELYELRNFTVKQAHGNFLSAIRDRFSYCTIAVEDVEKMYSLGQHDKGMTNNWLYKKTALSQFQMRAMGRGFNVIEVNPSYTSQVCHKCGHVGVSYGKGNRLFQCPSCGLTDYHRDINAARNIAWLGEGNAFDFSVLSEEKKTMRHLKLVKAPLQGKV